MDHVDLHLSQIGDLESVSRSGTAPGYIEFKDFGRTTCRCQISDSDYIEPGEVSSLADVAGPVCQLQFTCYGNNGMLSPITNANVIRLINVEETVNDGNPSHTLYIGGDHHINPHSH